MLRLNHAAVDLVRRTVVAADGARSRLTAGEAELLGFLASRPGEVLAREELLVEVWGYHPSVRSRAVDHTMRRLRAKLERDPSEPEHLLSEYGRGYRFVPAVGSTAERSHHAPWVAWGSRFFGRQDELAELRSLAATERAVVVTGPPGVGKSRLVHELARGARSEGADVRIAEVAGALTAAEVLGAVGLALDLPPAAESWEAIGAAVASWGPLWLVLDQADEVVEEVLRRVLAWRRGAVDLVVLLTRRGPLPQTPTLALGGMEAAAGAQLLVDRALLAGIPEAPPPLEVLIGLVESLEGLPLALELAAPLLRVMGAGRLRGWLAERGVAGGEAVRHAIDALTATDQEALGRLASFAGAFDIDLALGMLDGEGVVSRVQRLADRGLLVRQNVGDDVRLRLSGAVRTAAWSRLAVAQQEANRRRCAEVVVRAGEAAFAALEGRERSAACADLAALRDDLLLASKAPTGRSLGVRAVVLLAAPIDRVPPAGLLERLDEALSATDDLSASLEVALRLARARLHLRQGTPTLAAPDLAAVETIATRQGLVEARCQGALLRASSLGGAVGGTPTLLRSVLELAVDHPLQASRAHRLFAILGGEGAGAHLDAALEAATRADAPAEVCAVRLARGVGLLNQGRLADALLDLEWLESEVEAAGARQLGPQVLAALGFARGLQGQVEAGEVAMRRALQQTARSGGLHLVPYAECNLGNFLLFHGRSREALACYRSGLDHAQARADRTLVAVARSKLGAAHQLGEEPEAARLHYLEALPELEAAGRRDEAAVVHMQLALLDATDAPGAARQHVRLAWREAGEATSPLNAVLEFYEAAVEARLGGGPERLEAARIALERGGEGRLSAAERTFAARVAIRMVQD